MSLTLSWNQGLFIYLFLAFTTYGFFLDNPFLMDDEVQIVNNSAIKSLDQLENFFLRSTMGTDRQNQLEGLYYKPLMTSYYAVVWHFFGANPVAFRAPLLVLHTLNAFILFLFSALFFSRPLSFMLGALFLLHPLNSEVVLYVADAQDVLFLFFGLLSFSIFFYEKGTWWYSVLSGFFLLLSLFSKETGILFLPAILFWSFLFEKRKIKWAFALFCSVLAIYAFCRFQAGLFDFNDPKLILHSASLAERLRLIPAVLGHYLENFFFPWRLSITTDFILTHFSLEQFWLPLLIVVLGLWGLVFTFFKASNHKMKSLYFFFLVLLIFWFLLHSHLIIPLDGVYADRWGYFASWIFLSFIFMVLHENHFLNKYRTPIFILVLSLFIVRDVCRGQDWADPLRFYQREAQMHPWDALMNNNVGVELFRSGQYLESRGYLETATKANLRWALPLCNLGAVAERMGDLNLALSYYQKSLQIETTALATENYAKLICRESESKECSEFVSAGLKQFPHNAILKTLSDFLNSRGQ